MGIRVLWPIVLLLLLDILEAVIIIGSWRLGSYETSMLTAYLVLGFTIIQLGLCAYVLFIRTPLPNLPLMIIYVGHAIASVVVFGLAETGTFYRGD